MRPLLRDLFIVVLLASGRCDPCTEYGCPGKPQYEPFVPAPPGHTPRCAKPGQTFCESPDHYPQQLIKFLVEKCTFDFSTVLTNESQEDYNTYRSPPEYHQGYEYPRQEVLRLHLQALPFPQYQTGQPAMTYGPPSNATHHNGYKYAIPPRSQRNPFLPEIASSAKYHHNIQYQSDRPNHSHGQPFKSFGGQDQSWWANRYSRSSKLTPRTHYENPLLDYGKLKRERVKRQANPDFIALCPTTPQFITPRAALNNQGNWMYVVNLQETDKKYSQLVRSETCTTDRCNGVCSTPEGYTSRCQQQYVQKRLVALEGSGNRLYTDVFWFPHGCSCQVQFNQ